MFNFKKCLVAAFTIASSILFSACGQQVDQNQDAASQPEAKTEASVQAPSFNPPEAFAGKKILVAYYSRPGDNYQVGVIEVGNTKILADMIAQEIGADEFEIKTVKEYPFNYKECTEVAKQEQADNARPELSTKIENLADYDLIFLGYPIWWGDLPMCVYTFLESYDWNGKTIVPFCTSAGNAMTGKETSIPQFAKGSSVLATGLGIQGARCQGDQASVRNDVKSWLSQIGFVAK